MLDRFPQMLLAMRFVGGGYLLFLAFRALRTAFSPARPAGPPDAAASSVSEGAYGRGFLVVMTNPKAALMWVAVSMFLASSGMTSWQFLAIGLGASATAMIIYGTYAVLFSTGVAVRAYTRFFRWIEGAFGAVFGLVGGRLLLDGLRELRS
jgi:threonine/homoserine/homoserine lactone efflux protein